MFCCSLILSNLSLYNSCKLESDICNSLIVSQCLSHTHLYFISLSFFNSSKLTFMFHCDGDAPFLSADTSPCLKQFCSRRQCIHHMHIFAISVITDHFWHLKIKHFSVILVSSRNPCGSCEGFCTRSPIIWHAHSTDLNERFCDL